MHWYKRTKTIFRVTYFWKIFKDILVQLINLPKSVLTILGKWIVYKCALFLMPGLKNKFIKKKCLDVICMNKNSERYKS